MSRQHVYVISTYLCTFFQASFVLNIFIFFITWLLGVNSVQGILTLMIVFS